MKHPKFIHIAAEAALAPDAWSPLFAPNLPAERRLAYLDAQAVGGAVHIYLPAHLNLERFVQGASVQRRPDAISTPQLTRLPSGACLEVSGTGPVTLEFAGHSVTITPRPPASDLNGMRVLMTITDTFTPDQIAAWVQYHVETQGAQAVALIRRLKPNQPSDPQPLLTALRQTDIATIALYDISVATGQPGSPACSAQFHAPDGPGKSGRTYNLDVWHAPLNELGVLQAVRTTLLANAASVLFCDVSDLMIPPQHHAPTVFQLAETSESYVRLQGRAAYPWRRQDIDAPAAHAEHGAVSFDGAALNPIWCISPTGPMRGAHWQPHQISTAPADPRAPTHGFWRCMAVMHPGVAAAALAPKSSLVPDNDLTALIQRQFGLTPEQPPTASTDAVQTLDPDQARVLIVTTMKNEGPFILEWLAWHRAIGVSDFLVYTNDCTDGTDQMFDLLHAKGMVEHRKNPYRATGEKPQHAAYRDAQTSQTAGHADWIICMDVDEFINIHTGAGRLPDLFRAVPDATMIALTWQLYGNAEVVAYRDQLITEQFVRCAPEFIRKPHQAWGIKTMFRPLDHYKKFGVHRPKGLRPECLPQINWVNGSGKPMPEQMLRTGWRSNVTTYGYQLVTLNHYSLRSAESYLVKRDRGQVNHVDRDQGLNYWFRMNNNAHRDTRARDHLPMVKAELERLMSDPQIAAQHHACVAAHQAKIASLKQRPDYAILPAIA